MHDTLPAFWKWDDVLPESLLTILDAESQSTPRVQGTLDGGRVAHARDSSIVMLPPSHWFCGVLLNFAIQANMHANWKRDISFPECLQFSDYGIGQHYDWHVDATVLTAAEINRKLSIVCLLSDPREFDGGMLELEHIKEPIILKRGSIIVFPSLLRHRVTPVTRGFRTTIVSWVLGPTVW